MNNTNDNYRDKYRHTLKQIVMLLVLALALGLSYLYIMTVPIPVKNYATKASGEVVKLQAVSEPIITQDHLLDWAQIATRTAFNIDFANYKQQMAKSEHLFTTGAWRQFQKSLVKTGLLKAVIDQKLVMQAVVTGTAVIVAEGVFQGRYMWKVQLPLLVNYSSASTQQKTNLVINLTIARVLDLGIPEGIQIESFSAVEGTINQREVGGRGND